ncbi:MAG: tol-pal system protein YbgF [Pseudomonadota bacterium]
MVRLLSVIVSLALLTGAQAQDRTQTLADIRQELSVLYVEVRRLKRELSTTGGVSTQSVGGSTIDRLNAIEAEMTRLTSLTEQLQFRIDSVVRDGTNQIGDLEFRLCELEAGCDIATLGQGTTLGGVEPATSGTATAVIQPQTGTGTDTGAATDGVQLAVGEQADFDSAMAALEGGDNAGAAAQFDRFLTNYPGSPLTTEARLMRGAALEGTGESTQAARAYLEAFSDDPNGAKAPEALFLLGRSLGRIGQVDEACVTLAEVGLRFPGGEAAGNAQAERTRLNCP